MANQISTNFTDDEFRCPCCGEMINNLAFKYFLSHLQDARTIAGIPFVITSGYRCPEHNKRVGGTSNSSHMEGVAADIAVKDNHSRMLMIKSLLDAGFMRLGIGTNYIHADMDTEKMQALVWVYGSGG